MADVTRLPSAKKVKRYAIILLAVTASLAGILALLVYAALYDSETLRYRLTYEVEVDGEVRSGTGVVQVHVYKRPASVASSEIGFEVTGEAIAVDLGDRGYLFSLLSGRSVMVSEWSGHITSPDKLLWLAFDCPSRDVLDYFHCLDRVQPSVSLPFRLLPALATFEEIDDPSTLRLVEPVDLEAHFGPGSAIKNVTIEITNDPATEGRIEEILPWLAGWQEFVITPEYTFHRFHFRK